MKTLQRFARKCVSFVLAVPGARLFSREVNRAIGMAAKNSRSVKIYHELRDGVFLIIGQAAPHGVMKSTFKSY